MRTVTLRATAFALAFAAAFAAGVASAATTAEVEALIKQRAPNALSQAQALVDADEANARAWTLLARAQLMQGEPADAVESAEQAVELAPNDAQAQLWLGNSLGVRIGEVNMLRQVAMAPDLRDAFEAAVRLDPGLFDARTALIQYYLRAPEAMGGGTAKAKAQVAEIAKRNAVRGHLAQAMLDRAGLRAGVVAGLPDAGRTAVPAGSHRGDQRRSARRGWRGAEALPRRGAVARRERSARRLRVVAPRPDPGQAGRHRRRARVAAGRPAARARQCRSEEGAGRAVIPGRAARSSPPTASRG